MVFSKTFPRTMAGTNYPLWEEISLTAEEELQAEEECQKENVQLLDRCLDDAKRVAIKNGLNTDENQVNLAIALFEKRASHAVFRKEIKAKEKFNEKFR